MSGTGKFAGITAEPERDAGPPWWVRGWRLLTPAEWAVLVVTVCGVYGLFWWLSGDPVVAVFVLAGVVLVVGNFAGWIVYARTLTRYYRRVAMLESWQCSDRAEFLDHVARERNAGLDVKAEARGWLAGRSVPGQRQDGDAG